VVGGTAADHIRGHAKAARQGVGYAVRKAHLDLMSGLVLQIVQGAPRLTISPARL